MPSLNRYDPASRYRQRTQQRLAMSVIFLLLIAAGGAVGYALGYQGAGLDMTHLERQVVDLQKERDRLQGELTRLMADSHSAALRASEMARQMASGFPQDGVMRDISARLREQIEAGVAPERLVHVIASLSPPKDCSEPEIKRFVVQTPTNKKAGGFVVIADGALTIRGKGQPSKGKTGAIEAWYDPAQPVQLSFEWNAEGLPKVLEKKAVLPISQVLTVAGREYRITVDKGAKSFAKVMFDSCAAP